MLLSSSSFFYSMPQVPRNLHAINDTGHSSSDNKGSIHFCPSLVNISIVRHNDPTLGNYLEIGILSDFAEDSRLE